MTYYIYSQHWWAHCWNTPVGSEGCSSKKLSEKWEFGNVPCFKIWKNMTCNERFVFFYIYPKTTLTIVCNLTKWEETNMWGCYYFLVGILTVKRTQCSREGESSYIKQHAFCSAGSFAFWVLGKLSASKYLRSSIFAVLEGKRNPIRWQQRLFCSMCLHSFTCGGQLLWHCSNLLQEWI